MKIVHIIAIVFITLAVTSCNNSKSKEEHGHDHDEKLQLIAYNSEFEVFAEATPLVVGQQSEILSHFTYLKNFKPLENASVTASLIINNSGVRQTLNSHTRPGIYKFVLQPSIVGTGSIIFDIKTAETTSRLVISDITVFENEHDAQHAASTAVLPSTNTVSFTKEQSWKIDFNTEVVEADTFGNIIRAVGQLQPSQGAEVIVSAKTSGIVNFSDQLVLEGKEVRAGQSLLSIDGSNISDNNLWVRYTQAESEFNNSKAELQRKEILAKDNLISQSELIKARSNFEIAQANFNNLKRNFAAGKQSLNSPIQGFITSINVRNGQYVEQGQPILVISQNRELIIRAELNPRYFKLLANVIDVNFRFMNDNQLHMFKELNGKMLSYSRSVNIDNPLIQATFQVENKQGFLPGSFVEMFIKTQNNEKAITVPNEGIIEEMGNYFVYVQLTPELFEKRGVQKGSTDGKRTEILDGLSIGERVVGKGAILVKLAQAAQAIDPHSGHVH